MNKHEPIQFYFLNKSTRREEVHCRKYKKENLTSASNSFLCLFFPVLEALDLPIAFPCLDRSMVG